jgi:hypothetical protein
MKSFFLALSFLALAGCNGPNSISGNLRVLTSLNVLGYDGGVTFLTPSTYRASVKMGKTKGEFTIQTIDGNVTFAVPGVVENTEGEFSIPASSLRQEFGVQGVVNTSDRPFDRVLRHSCVWGHRQEQRCYADGRGFVRCHWETVMIPGTQRERQRGVSTVRSVTVALVQPSRSPLAQFNGSYTLGEDIHSRELIGYCERSGW